MLELIFGVIEAISMVILEPVVRLYRRLRVVLLRWRISIR
jgi:hypothetical protein